MPKMRETQVWPLGWEDSLEGNDNPLPYSCLENPTDRGAWQSTVHRAANIWIQLMQLSIHTHTAKTPVSHQKFSSLYLRRWHFTPNSGLYNNYSHSVDEEADSGKLSLHCLVCLHLQSFLYLHLCALQVFGHLSSLCRVLHFLWWLIPLFFFFNWRIVDSQYCVNFRCTAEYISVFADFIPL